MRVTIETRKLIFVNTDPQRRCYDGCHFSGEFVWTQWSPLETVLSERSESRLSFWRELNDYAVSQGRKDKSEYRLVP